MDFEWDEAKRLHNLEKHGIDFIDIQVVFDGRPEITEPSPRFGEERFVTTAIVDDRFVSVIWTERHKAGSSRQGAHVMENEENIVSYTADELAEMRARGEGKTDWARVDAMTDEELEASIDFEEEGEPDGSTVYVGLPHFIAEGQFRIRIDKDVLEWFSAQSSDYPQLINTVLRNYIEAEQQKARDVAPTVHGAAAHR